MLYLEAVSYDPHDWRLFLDSLKFVLNHNGIEYASVPIRHSVHAKETHGNIERLLSQVGHLREDLKIVNFLLGQQGGYIKYSYFLCLWDCRAKDRHWTLKHGQREKHVKLVENIMSH